MEEPCSVSHRPCLVAERKGRGTVRVSATVVRGAVCDGTARQRDHAQGSAERALHSKYHLSSALVKQLAKRMINERRRRMSLKRRKVTKAGG